MPPDPESCRQQGGEERTARRGGRSAAVTVRHTSPMDAPGSSPRRQPGGLEVRRAADQFVTERDGITTRHCFSFGDHYDPERIRLGPLVALNDEQLPPRTGYATHHHRDLDIVTWVLDGALRHEDSTGRVETVRPGTVQHLTTGTGVDHSETNAGEQAQQPLRFLQVWFALDEDVEPAYETHPALDERQEGWTTIAAGSPVHATRLAVPGVEVAVCLLPTGAGWGGGQHGAPGRADVESFVYLATGSLRLPDGNRLWPGDSVQTAPGTALTGAAEEALELLAVTVSATARDR